MVIRKRYQKPAWNRRHLQPDATETDSEELQRMVKDRCGIMEGVSADVVNRGLAHLLSTHQLAAAYNIVVVEAVHGDLEVHGTSDNESPLLPLARNYRGLIDSGGEGAEALVHQLFKELHSRGGRFNYFDGQEPDEEAGDEAVRIAGQQGMPVVDVLAMESSADVRRREEEACANTCDWESLCVATALFLCVATAMHLVLGQFIKPKTLWAVNSEGNNMGGVAAEL